MAVDPIIGGALIGGGLDLLGGLFSNNSAAKAARAQRNWEERMSNTAVQRRVADLQKANLNPMLAFMGSGVGGVQASTPSTQAAKTADFSQIGSRAVSSAVQAKLMSEQIYNLRAQTTERLSQSWKNEAEAKEVAERTGVYGPNIEKVKQELENLKIQGRLTNAELSRLEQMTPLIVEAQRLANSLTKANLAPAQIMERVYQDFPALRRIQAIRDVIFGSGSGVIRPLNSH